MGNSHASIESGFGKENLKLFCPDATSLYTYSWCGRGFVPTAPWLETSSSAQNTLATESVFNLN